MGKIIYKKLILVMLLISLGLPNLFVEVSNATVNQVGFFYSMSNTPILTDKDYNRFRYYLPDEGIYTQRDPIGLAGGNPTVYGYGATRS